MNIWQVILADRDGELMISSDNDREAEARCRSLYDTFVRRNDEISLSMKLVELAVGSDGVAVVVHAKHTF